MGKKEKGVWKTKKRALQKAGEKEQSGGASDCCASARSPKPGAPCGRTRFLAGGRGDRPTEYCDSMNKDPVLTLARGKNRTFNH